MLQTAGMGLSGSGPRWRVRHESSRPCLTPPVSSSHCSIRSLAASPGIVAAHSSRFDLEARRRAGGGTPADLADLA